MTSRQALAHANPLARAIGDPAPFTETHRTPLGVLITILTVNR